ncbi:MAG: copper resistance protein NlpE N-terminal domain-containing protein [Anaerolineae bacterium]|nr:copper resistance protein NlpE N-terminal domain-containing protein [Anaerolineae bacterium]
MPKKLIWVFVLLLALSVSAFQIDNNLIGRWRWQQTQESSGDVTTPLDPARYTIEFMANGRVAVQADCNGGSGIYTTGANTLDIGELVTTKAACPAGSSDTEFLRQLDEVISYLFKDGNLYLELPVDSGSMEFVRADQPGPAAPTASGQAYTVQADDWLSKIAEKTYGDPLAYAAIVAATNELAAQVSTFKPITDPNIVEVGQQLWLPDSKFVGTYQASLPAASSPGRQMSLTLRLDGTAELSTDYLNGEAPVVETGTWQDNNDGTATVSLTGQAGGVVYEAPVVITFQLRGNTLTAVAYDQTLYGSEGLTLERQGLAPAAGQGEDVVGIYKALLPAASSPGIDSTLYLNIDNTVRLVEDYLNGVPPIVEIGNWQSAGDQVMVTVSGQEGEVVYDTPNVITFDLTGNGLATTPDEDLYGSAGRRYLRFDALANGEQAVPYDATAAAGMMTGSGPAGIYKGFSPAASCCGLDWTLFLNPDNSARLKSDYLNGEAPILEDGTWQVADNTLTVTLTGAEKPMTFQVADGTLVSNEFSIFGEMPLRLYRFDVAAQSSP